MRHSISASLGLTLTFLTWLAPQTADACSCLQPPPPAKALADAAVVFEGRSFRSEEIEGDQIRFEFEVTRSWKGAPPATVAIVSHKHSATCGRGYAEGVSYLVYASEMDGILRDNLCSRTRKIEDASEDLSVLGPGKSPGAAEPEPQTDMPTEPPRIEPTPAPAADDPPPSEPGKRGCSVNGDSAPGAPTAFAFALVVAIRRSRAVGSRTRGEPR